MTCAIHEGAALPCMHCDSALADIRSWPAVKIDYAARERSRKVSSAAYRSRATFNGFGHVRYKSHCKHGHEYTPANTYWYKTTAGRKGRQCKACWRTKYQAAKARRKAA